jgi:hypothetical protein
MEGENRWVVTTSGDRPMARVAEDLAGEGFTVDEVLHEIGSITGAASAEVAQKLSKIAGVTDVSPEPGADVGPPGSPETW